MYGSDGNNNGLAIVKYVATIVRITKPTGVSTPPIYFLTMYTTRVNARKFKTKLEINFL